MPRHATKRDRPNILVVMTDQWSGTHTRWAGCSHLKTPHLDRLAERAVLFDNAYCASPLCAPSRFAFMSGRLPSKIAAYDNASEFPSIVPTFAHYLRRSGYRTVLCGKMHFVGADQLHGFEERLTTDVYPADFAWTPDWRHPDDRIAWWYHNLLPVKQAGVAEISNQLAYDDEVAARARLRLYDAARRDERPWLMCVSFTHPHDPYACRKRYWDRYDHNAVSMPNVGPIAYADLDPHSRRLHRVSAMDHFEVTNDDVRRARHAYDGALSYLDEQIGTLLRILDETGQAENTVIVFTSDHGDMLGERGMWYKMSFFEPSSRVPLLIHWPRRFEPRRVATNVSLLDVLPTLVDLAKGEGAAPETFVEPLDGESLVPLMEGGRLGRGDQITAEFMAEGAVAPMVMLKNGDLKYVHCEADPPQLFDLATDPLEATNLAIDPANAGRLAMFAAEVVMRYDLADLKDRIMHHQQVRLMVSDALRQGRYVPWDYQPFTDESRRFMRNHLDLNEVEATARFPRATTPEPAGAIKDRPQARARNRRRAPAQS